MTGTILRTAESGAAEYQDDQGERPRASNSIERRTDQKGEHMSDYSLTVINHSEMMNNSPTFAVMAELPEAQTGNALSTAWITQVIHSSNTYTFTWNIEWGFAWAATGATAGYQWSGNGHIKADPGSAASCAAKFDYQKNDFVLTYTSHAPSATRDQLWIEDSKYIPEPKTQASSVGVTLNGKPTTIVEAGPNLEQTYTLHPTYYLVAGGYVEGQMVSVSSLTGTQKLPYVEGVTALTATLKDDNTWDVQNTKDVNFAKALAL